jgi:hypothetical protein
MYFVSVLNGKIEHADVRVLARLVHAEGLAATPPQLKRSEGGVNDAAYTLFHDLCSCWRWYGADAPPR